MFFTIALPLALVATINLHEPENVVIEYQDIHPSYAAKAEGEEVWIKDKIEYFLARDMTNRQRQTKGIPTIETFGFTGPSKIRVYDRTLSKQIDQSRPDLFLLIGSNPTREGVGTYTLSEKSVPLGYRALVYVIRTTRTSYEKRYDKDQGKFLVCTYTEVSHSFFLTMINAGESYDPRTGKIYTGKDLNIPRYPSQPIK